jgi:hypothetical protein
MVHLPPSIPQGALLAVGSLQPNLVLVFDQVWWGEHLQWYLHLLKWGLLVAILNSGNVGFGLRDPDLHCGEENGIYSLATSKHSRFLSRYQSNCWFTQGLMFHPFCLPLYTLCVKHFEKSPSETWRAPTEFQKGHESGDEGHQNLGSGFE